MEILIDFRAELKDQTERERRINIANKELEFIRQSEAPDPVVKSMPFR